MSDTLQLTAREHRAAGERAEEATLWHEAVPAYETALSLVANGDAPEEDEGVLLTALGRCYWNLSEARTAWRTLRRAITLCSTRGDATGMARATVEVLRIWGPPERHKAMAEEALEALGPDGDPYLRAQLLMRLRWFEDDFMAKFNESMAIAEEHGFEDLLANRIIDDGWRRYDEGDTDGGIALHRKGHETLARMKQYEQAASALRGAGFATLVAGRLDEGLAFAHETIAYARSVHMKFTESLGVTDAAGVLFARCEFDACLALLDELPNNVDFRADLYRMWIVELRGDTAEARRQMVDPERAGKAPTGMSQTHAAAAGVLYHAGNEDSARQEMQAWFEISRDDDDLADEAPALWDCIIALGNDELWQALHKAFQQNRQGRPTNAKYATLQGRAMAPARGAVALRLGHIDDADRVYREGTEWCERERLWIDAGLCHVGLADVATARGHARAAQAHIAHAAALFEQHGAKLWLDRLVAPRLV